MDMEDLNDLIFDSDTGLYTDDCFDVDPSTSLKEMEVVFSNDKDDDSKEIEDISYRHRSIEPMPKFNDLEVFISKDEESANENETNVQ